MVIEAPAKVNLTLKVLGRRDDGFHSIETFMQAISLHDDVSVQWIPEDGGQNVGLGKGSAAASAPAGLRVDLHTFIEPGSAADNGNSKALTVDLDNKNNLAYRAAELVHSKFKPELSGRLIIDITKRIPIAAGLAGGSADGAAVLTALQVLWSVPEEDVFKLAPELGSDVAFSFAAQHGLSAAVGGGRGEILTPVADMDAVFVLYNPGFGVSTPAVYAEWDKQTKAALSEELHAAKSANEPAFAAADNHSGNSAGVECKYFNDLQKPAISVEPEIAKGLDTLWGLDPAPQHVQLSGSGPTVFALYPADTDVEKLKKSLQLQAPRAIIVKPLRNTHL